MPEKIVSNVSVLLEDDGNGKFYIPFMQISPTENYYLDGVSYVCLTTGNIDAYLWIEQYGEKFPFGTIQGQSVDSPRYRQIKVNLVGPFRVYIELETASAGNQYRFTFWGWCGLVE